jgi:hypothetical protein
MLVTTRRSFPPSILTRAAHRVKSRELARELVRAAAMLLGIVAWGAVFLLVVG